MDVATILNRSTALGSIAVILPARRCSLGGRGIDQFEIHLGLRRHYAAVEPFHGALGDDGVNGFVDMTVDNIFPGAHICRDELRKCIGLGVFVRLSDDEAKARYCQAAISKE